MAMAMTTSTMVTRSGLVLVVFCTLVVGTWLAEATSIPSDNHQNEIEQINCVENSKGQLQCSFVLDKNPPGSSSSKTFDSCTKLVGSDNDDHDGRAEACVKVIVEMTQRKDSTRKLFGDEDSSLAKQQRGPSAPGPSTEEDEPNASVVASSVVAVGTTEYEMPFSQYGGREVVECLNKLASPRKLADASSLSTADLYGELGLAHRDEMLRMLVPGGGGHYGNHGEWGIQALMESLKLYERLVSETDSEYDSVVRTRAELGVYLGEMYELSQQIETAVEVYVKSEDMFDLLLRKEWDYTTIQELQLGWADAANRVAALKIAQIQGVAILAQTTAAMTAKTQYEEEQDTTTIIEEQRIRLEKCTDIFRSNLENMSPSGAWNKSDREIQLGDALNNFGVVLVTAGKLEDAALALEESLPLQQSLPRMTANDAQKVIYTLHTLVDVSLQLGRYDESKKWYKNVIQEHRKWGLSDAERAFEYMNIKESLEPFQKQLEQYYESLREGNNMVADEKGNMYDMQPDELYEADLLLSIGTFLLAGGKFDEAAEYLSRAVDLYVTYEQQELQLGDALMSLSSVQMQLEEYVESVSSYDKALDIYRKVVGEGKNPLLEREGLVQSFETGDHSKGSEKEELVHEALIDIESYATTNITPVIM